MRSITSISTKTQVCAIIGNPVGHSLSPAIHNAAFEALEISSHTEQFIVTALRRAGALSLSLVAELDGRGGGDKDKLQPAARLPYAVAIACGSLAYQLLGPP